MADQNIVERNTPSFDARRYWEERLQAHPDITGVGYLGLSPEFVELQYRARMRQLEQALRQYQLLNLAGRSVLDVGAGTGIWVNFWRQHGAARVVGLDFAQPSVDQLKKRFPDALIVQADLSVSPLPLPQESAFDVISAFDVLLHIVDPDGFRRAIANLGQQCAPGGWLIISDPIVEGQHYVPARAYSAHNKVRSLADYDEVLKANGFAIQSIRPANVLLNTPLEASSHLMFQALLASWKISRLWGRSNVLSKLLGPALLVTERLACRYYPSNIPPGSKVIFARKLV